MKVISTEMFHSDQLPDHILQQIEDLAMQIGLKVDEIVNKKQHPQIVLNAICLVHAAIITQLITDDNDCVEKAAKNQATALYNNIKYCKNMMKIKKNDN